MSTKKALSMALRYLLAQMANTKFHSGLRTQQCSGVSPGFLANLMQHGRPPMAFQQIKHLKNIDQQSSSSNFHATFSPERQRCFTFQSWDRVMQRNLSQFSSGLDAAWASSYSLQQIKHIENIDNQRSSFVPRQLLAQRADIVYIPVLEHSSAMKSFPIS